jgi:hypothetical protein
MTDKLDLLILPNPDDSLIVPSEIRSSLAARGRSDASALLARKEPAYLAQVRVNGKWGLIDRFGNFVANPIFHALRDFHEGRAAFCDWVGGGKSSDQFFKENSILWHDYRYTFYADDFGPGLIADPCAWGFLDSSGKPISAARFEFVRLFREGLAGVRLHGKWGFIDRSGEFVIEPRFDGVRDFQGDLCQVYLDGKYGLINAEGDFVIQPRLYYLGEYSEGLAPAAEIAGRYGYIDSNGSFAIEPQFARADGFHCGRARVYDLADHVGYINTVGDSIYQCKKIEENTNMGRKGLGDFVDDIAFVTLRRRIYTDECEHLRLVSSDEGEGHRVCIECSSCTHEYCDPARGIFLDSDGKSIIESQDHFLNAAAPFSGGLGMVERTIPENWHTFVDGYPAWKAYGFVDAKGQVKIAPQFVQATPFKNGRAVALVKDVGWRMIDRDGAVVGESIPGLNPNWMDSHGFKEGLASIMVGTYPNEKVGFIDSEGRTVIEPQFDAADDFVNGLAVVCIFGDERQLELTEIRDNSARIYHKDKNYGYIDRTGGLVIPCRFEEARAFQQVTT